MKRNTLLKLLPVAAVAGATLVHATPASAQSRCTSTSKVSAAIWERWGEAAKKYNCDKAADSTACLEKAGKLEAATREMIAFWNSMSGNSWATIGPRELMFSGKMDGKVVLGGERLFLTKLPVEEGNKLRVTVKKEGGKAPAKVTLAIIDEENRCLTEREVTFSAKDKNGTTKTLSISGFKGKLLALKVNASKGRAFDYEITATKR